MGSLHPTASECGPHSASKLCGGWCEPTVPRGEVESWAGPASLFPAPSPERPVPSYLFLLHTSTGQGHLGGGISCPRATSCTAMPNRKGCLHLYLTLTMTQLSTMGKSTGCRALVSTAHFQQQRCGVGEPVWGERERGGQDEKRLPLGKRATTSFQFSLFFS